MHNKILVSILNWNNTAATNDCLKSIASIQKSEQPDILLIDNNSLTEELSIDPETLESLKSIKITKNEINKGFAGGHNDSIKYAKENNYDYICLLNNDTTIIDKYLFEKLTNAIEESKNAIASAPTVLHTLNPPTIWYGGGNLVQKTAKVGHKKLDEILDMTIKNQPEEVSFLTGCCLMISLKDKSLDLTLSTDYFLYWEDTDWCARMTSEGLKLMYVADAKIFHNTSSSLGVRSSRYAYYNIRNRLLFAHRWSSLYRVLPSNIIVSLKYIVLSLKHPTTTPKISYYSIKALIDGIRNIPGALK